MNQTATAHQPKSHTPTREQQRRSVLDCLIAKFGPDFIVRWRPWALAGGAPVCPPKVALLHREGMIATCVMPKDPPGLVRRLAPGKAGIVVQDYGTGVTVRFEYGGTSKSSFYHDFNNCELFPHGNPPLIHLTSKM